MAKPDKVIFLDIDGPMISNTGLMLNRCASFSQTLDSQAVDVLHAILGASGAKLVFNTTHNSLFFSGVLDGTSYSTPGLRQRFVDAGFENHFHEHPQTVFPNINRYDSITHWLTNHKTEHMLWVALDDVEMPNKRCCLVDPNYGIGIKEFNFCAQYLMYKPKHIL